MKKLVKNHKSLVVAMVLVFSMLVTPFRALAANADTDVQAKIAEVEQNAIAEMENAGVDDTVQPMDIQPRAHTSYYPTRGVNSGYFSGRTSDNVAIYSYLPSGTMKFSYSMSGGDTCYLRFYRGEGVGGSPYRSAALNANNYTGTSYVNLPFSGSYTVEVYFPNGNSSTELIYAFNLYTD